MMVINRPTRGLADRANSLYPTVDLLPLRGIVVHLRELTIQMICQRFLALTGNRRTCVQARSRRFSDDRGELVTECKKP